MGHIVIISNAYGARVYGPFDSSQKAFDWLVTSKSNTIIQYAEFLSGGSELYNRSYTGSIKKPEEGWFRLKDLNRPIKRVYTVDEDTYQDEEEHLNETLAITELISP